MSEQNPNQEILDQFLQEEKIRKEAATQKREGKSKREIIDEAKLKDLKNLTPPQALKLAKQHGCEIGYGQGGHITLALDDKKFFIPHRGGKQRTYTPGLTEGFLKFLGIQRKK